MSATPEHSELRLFDETPTLPTPVVARTAQNQNALPLPPMTTAQQSNDPLDLDPFVVEVKRSPHRKRTVGARLVGNVLKIVVPAWMSAAEEAHWVDVMTARFQRKRSTERVDLAERAVTLARRHDLPRPREIRWSDNMVSRWGSCTPTTGVIRISNRVAPFPDWVLNYVIVHEIAHLEVGDHSDEFWRLVHRYPRAERAIGYLIAKSGEDHE